MEWHYHKGNPILALGPRGTWDEVYATWASVVRIGQADWRMYYSGKSKTGWWRSPRLRIGLALSADGSHWRKFDGNPILDTGREAEWDSRGVYCPVVWQERGSWHMIFTGCSNGEQYQVGYAASRDGVLWTKASDNPRFCDSALGLNRSGVPETEAWGLLKSGPRYYLLYNTVTIKPRQIYVAESLDLVNWTPLSSDPLIPSEGMPSKLGYMKYCAWPQPENDQILVFVATSNENYTKSAIGLWRMKSFLEEKEFVGYVVNTSEDWCSEELDTPFIVNNLLDSNREIRLYFGGRANGNKWCEGLAFLKL